jgi:hypothetical protein
MTSSTQKPSLTATADLDRSNPALRPPEKVMQLARMGASFPTRLSFSRRLLRQLSKRGATFERSRFDINDEGHGRAAYAVTVDGHTYTLCACTQPLDPAERTDRVIATAWDAAFVLHDGVPDEDDFERIMRNAPHQEVGRFEARDLVLSRANKSIRLFEHVVAALASGRQPDEAALRGTGYLMRTTAVYGNGKFGIADRERIADRAIMNAPFQVEMLTVFLIREFTVDLVEHLARVQGGITMVSLSLEARRYLGIGNATGLGMAPFLVAHPILMHRWVAARETALANVKQLRPALLKERYHFHELLRDAKAHVAEWHVDEQGAERAIRRLGDELCELEQHCTLDWLDSDYPWARVHDYAESLSPPTEELIVALLIELHPDVVDPLAEQMASTHSSRLEPAMDTGELTTLAKARFGWARDLNFDTPRDGSQFWYVSEEKLEPRLGQRFEEPGAQWEMPLGIAKDAQQLLIALEDEEAPQSVARFLMKNPALRDITRRLQTVARHPYSEICDNLLASTCLPVDMLRFKLAFFGATRFDPRSSRWTRITLYQGAPIAADLTQGQSPDWTFPVLQLP